MKRRFLVALASSALLASTLTTAPTTAQAAGSVTVTSPSCGKIKFVNTTNAQVDVGVDAGRIVDLAAHGSFIWSLPGGSYSWAVLDAQGGATKHGYVNVATCPGTKPRPARGDFTGDGVADVLAVTKTGDLYAYAMTSRGLANGKKVGNGWGTTRWMQRVENWYGAGKVMRKLIAVRNDGTVWRYDDLGGGRFGTGVKIGSGFGSFTSFTVLPTNSPFMTGANSLVAYKPGETGVWLMAGDTLMGGTSPVTKKLKTVLALSDFTGDRFAGIASIDTTGRMTYASFGTERQIGSGWGGMTAIASPGSLDKDRLSDLITRHSNGNLYKYTNRGGRWGEAQRIGVNWNGIRFLA